MSIREARHGEQGCTGEDEWFYSPAMSCWICWWNEIIVRPLNRLGRWMTRS